MYNTPDKDFKDNVEKGSGTANLVTKKIHHC